MTFSKRFFRIFQVVSFVYVGFCFFMYILLKTGNTMLAQNIFNSILGIVIDALYK